MRRVQTLHFRIKGLFVFFCVLLSSAIAAGAPDHVPGRLLVVTRHGVDPQRLTRTLQLHGARIRRQVSPLGLSVVDVPEEASTRIRESLQASGLFEAVEPDYYAHTAMAATLVPNDPSFPNQWHLPKISAPQAWAVNPGSASIVVAVVDSGVDSGHPDLATKLVTGWNFLLNNTDTTDLVGHGTAVAGTIAPAANNGIGIAGVSWNSKIMPLVVVDVNEFAAYSNIATAIQYAVDHGAAVINVSIGGTNSSTALQSAVDYAWNHNVLVFASAMNNASTAPNYPAACNHAIAVSATDSTDSLSSFSNYGSWITLAAPGSSILTTSMGGGYLYWYGTSFASPIAAGVAALALSVNPTLTAPALASLMEQNTDDLGTPGFDSYFGWGRVNAYKVITSAQPLTMASAPATVSLNAGQIQQFTATIGGSAAPASWSISPTVGSISASGLYTAPAAVSIPQTVTVAASGSGGVTATSSITLVPVKVTVSPATVTLNPGQTQQLSATVTGTTNTAVAWSVSPNLGTISSTGFYNAPTSLSTAQTVTVTATGATGATGSATIAIAATSFGTSSFTPIRVNAGGPVYVDVLGQTWSADYGFTGGNTWSTASAVPSNPSPAVYQTCRWGVFSYGFAVPNGNYTVTLKFSEPSLGGAAQRLFNVALNGTTVLNNFDIYATAGGMNIAVDKSFPVAVTGGQVNLQFLQGAANYPLISGIQIVQAQPAFTAIRVNAGGPAFIDTMGQAWSADTGASGGNAWSTTGNITGTPSPALYQTCRWGTFTYAFAVPNGNYSVNLKFAEISLTGAGQRVFNVAINGSAALSNFDVYAAAGGSMIAVDKSLPVTVVNGQINIQFTTGSANYPLVNAIEILNSGATPASNLPTVRLNGGGAAYTDSKGQAWAADNSFSGGSTWSTTATVAGTADPTLYQSCRYGAFTYSFVVPNGTYTVNLKFAEISRTAPQQRLFNVALNGAPVLNGFDIVAAAGGPLIAVDRPFPVSVTNGQIVIQFSSGAADLPLINAIEIVPAATAGSTAPGLRSTNPALRVVRGRP